MLHSPLTNITERFSLACSEVFRGAEGLLVIQCLNNFLSYGGELDGVSTVTVNCTTLGFRGTG